ncbi:MAG: DUF6323 family protein [Clostridium sp.]|jgi:uncharacterized protein YabN with tetrapyrrole methylase and pyrophosphatase domain|uniref:DUF6323 family protein n=1 Tax=Clostridium sp. TaxID=1506 RepID=UPI0025BC669C|nr:DUF6323 family protein [Clostridium sp.]MCH3963351.1 DUF6323 family protein [Clostridium sp.]MCI1716781.1 DUF6323 family protein [Clostridium sp.]MCI1801035.1 DUF6323 family protein [Clostridium sp.]MCI1814967.1 DUF6323 family protein [Clostridium sp.]MCI1871868.1 DUF6323 family protein [Clostridium sp.]
MYLPEIFNSISMSRYDRTNEIIKLNKQLKKEGIVLTVKDAKEIITERDKTLKSTGRMEINMDVIHSIIKEVGKSPYVNQENAVETVNDIYEVFHYLKNSTSDLLSDSEILESIMFFYNEIYRGSIELVMGKGVEKIVCNFKNGRDLINTKEEED